MNARQIASLVRGRPTGKGRYQGKCPAHQDRNPSLSISEGKGGRVLLHCFAGCALDSILAALKVGRRDLFAGPPPTSAQVAAIGVATEAGERAKRAERKARLDSLIKLEKWLAVVNKLGAMLARSLGDDELSRLFHEACNQLHLAETETERWYPIHGVSAQDRWRT